MIESDFLDLRSLLSGADPVRIARALLGVEITSDVGGVITAGRITETEAYWAPEDRASHAFGLRRTKRTEPFYLPGGTSYVYLIYGIHELFNVITGPAGTPHGVLIRSIEPTQGVDRMLERRRMKKLKPELSRGPGVLTKALGITRQHNALDLLSDDSPVRLRAGAQVSSKTVIATPRIGIDGAGPEWAAKPWRFYLADTPYVSKLKAFE